MCHENVYRCSRFGRADCHPDLRAGECGADVAGELVIRLERLLIDNCRQEAQASDRI
jgi:hypothetical protein